MMKTKMPEVSWVSDQHTSRCEKSRKLFVLECAAYWTESMAWIDQRFAISNRHSWTQFQELSNQLPCFAQSSRETHLDDCVHNIGWIGHHKRINKQLSGVGDGSYRIDSTSSKSIGYHSPFKPFSAKSNEPGKYDRKLTVRWINQEYCCGTHLLLAAFQSYLSFCWQFHQIL